MADRRTRGGYMSGDRPVSELLGRFPEVLTRPAATYGDLLARVLPEFVRPVKILNMTTGEWMPYDGEIHRDDMDWLVWLLNEGYEMDWKLHLAEADQAS